MVPWCAAPVQLNTSSLLRHLLGACTLRYSKARTRACWVKSKALSACPLPNNVRPGQAMMLSHIECYICTECAGQWAQRQEIV